MGQITDRLPKSQYKKLQKSNSESIIPLTAIEFVSNIDDIKNVKKARNAIGALPTIQEDQVEQDTVDFKKI